ncbi:16S rRNA (cytosine(1402)-N(4))-methyltransferase RsmH [Candidatus Gracilibacteria bacterium]|nr:16S rRNA (cytosine(1402)-N(4))-methyltransferase RsmH [Candidatus Gracilibacteria bacterium]
MEKPKFGHIPVLLNELVDSIEIAGNRQNIVVDCTLGLGGHASKIIGKLNKGDIFVGFDADEDNLKNASLNIGKNIGEYIKEKNLKIYLINSNFRNLKSELNKIGIDKVSGIYYDLGVSSVHFDDENKGFSFRGEGILDMRFDRKSGLTAKDIVNSYSENDLYRIFREYGEEKKSKFIIDNILKSRIEKEIKTTKDLLEIIESSSFDPKSKLRVFQALRIEVNDEFGALKESLQDAVKLLDVGGIISVISFHSLEDRIVKKTFNEFIKTEINQITGMNMTQPILEKVHKKPLIPKQNELDSNPRSRSSKLRVLKKINNII